MEERCMIKQHMTDILDNLRSVRDVDGDTYSSMEVLGLINRAIEEIERLREALTDSGGGNEAD
jgi:hypothetical protein